MDGSPSSPAEPSVGHHGFHELHAGCPKQGVPLRGSPYKGLWHIGMETTTCGNGANIASWGGWGLPHWVEGTVTSAVFLLRVWC